jgi:lysozyme family protein
MQNLPRDTAKEIYRSDYWSACGCDHIPSGLADVVFKQSVNQGVGKASICLQKALNVTADGQIGPQTIRAANDYQPQSELIALFIAECILLYIQYDEFERYGKGWIKRAVLTAMEG